MSLPAIGKLWVWHVHMDVLERVKAREDLEFALPSSLWHGWRANVSSSNDKQSYT